MYLTAYMSLLPPAYPSGGVFTAYMLPYGDVTSSLNVPERKILRGTFSSSNVRWTMHNPVQRGHQQLGSQARPQILTDCGWEVVRYCTFITPVPSFP